MTVKVSQNLNLMQKIEHSEINNSKYVFSKVIEYLKKNQTLE